MSALRDGPNWVFAVQDNGIGMDPDQAQRSFVLFERIQEINDRHRQSHP